MRNQARISSPSAHTKGSAGCYIANEEMRYCGLGEIAALRWLALPEHFPTVELDLWVVMPNHVHGIVVLHEDGSARLTDVIGNYKAAVTRAWRRMGGIKIDPERTGGICPARTEADPPRTASMNPAPGPSSHQIPPDPQPIWHRSFHDHIIRNERALNQIRQYILANPARWSADTYYRA